MKVPPIPEGIIEIFLQPGEYYFGDRSTRIRTLLGSCVALILWHQVRLLGGMCHFLLPGRPTRPPGVPEATLDGRYADDAACLLLDEIGRWGSQPPEYVLKLFGGGRMFSGQMLPDVGERNVQAARELARRHGLHLVAEDLGGEGHRSVIFDIWSGDVWLKHTGLGHEPRERSKG